MDHATHLKEIIAAYQAEVTLSWFAALAQRVRLGTLVTGVIYRNPGVMGKIVTTLDVLSGARA